MFHSRPGGKRRTRVLKGIGREFSAALKLLILLLLLFVAFNANAQCVSCMPADTLSGGVLNPAVTTRKVIPYPYVREADVMWSKRIWRTLDLREKLNHPYYYPETPVHGLKNLFDLIKCGLLEGCITAFDNPVFDDEFKVRMTQEAVASLLVQKEVIDVEDPNNPGTFRRDTITTETTGSDILAYWVKEDWFFDKQRSVMDVRILGICPLATKEDPSTGEVIGYKPLFWLYFPQLRPMLVRQGVFLGQNFSQRLSYDDMFQKRRFSSYIHKESNVYDRTVNSYSSGIDALLEAEDIKENIMNFEHDLWHF